MQDDENTQVKFFVSANEFQSLFKVNYAYGPTYNNGKYIFTVDGRDTGNGIVVIDKNNYKKADFIPCNYRFSVHSVRMKCPDYKLKKLYITVSDENVPYGLFAIAEKLGYLVNTL